MFQAAARLGRIVTESVRPPRAAHSRQKMLPFLVNLAPGGSVEETTNPEGGELFLFVLRGHIEIDEGQQERLRIGKGDAVYVRTDRNRTFRNTGAKPAEWLAVQTPAVS